ncbi:hypothetical protein [Sphingobacterium sp.]|nr:hypothetical protein [Sphingobacterium sp.]
MPIKAYGKSDTIWKEEGDHLVLEFPGLGIGEGVGDGVNEGATHQRSYL